MSDNRTRKQIIKDTISDMVTDLLYYDRKEDSCLGMDDIDEAVQSGEISIEEIVHEFEHHLRSGVKA